MRGHAINAYLAVLIVTIAGAGAAMLIIHVAFADVPAPILHGSEAQYRTLQQSILQK